MVLAKMKCTPNVRRKSLRFGGVFFMSKCSQKFKSIEHFTKAFIDYKNKRIKGKLKGMSPVDYRIHSLKVS